MALGDSTAVGIGASSPALGYVGRVHAQLAAEYPRATLHNLGFPGATSADVLRFQVDAPVAETPHVITLSVGPNDLTEGTAPELFEAHIDEIIARLLRETEATVVITTLPDLSLAPVFDASTATRVGEQTVLFNEAITRAAMDDDVEIVDLYHLSRADGIYRPELVSRDGYHPSDAGYALWAEAVLGGIRARMQPSLLTRLAAREAFAQ